MGSYKGPESNSCRPERRLVDILTGGSVGNLAVDSFEIPVADSSERPVAGLFENQQADSVESSTAGSAMGSGPVAAVAESGFVS